MTATDELRRMLDERGVEWWEATPCKTKWSSPILGGPVAAREWNGEMVLDTGYIAVTHEQAIAATLGAGTCRDIALEGEWFECSECGTVKQLIHPNYCPNCGRKAVNE